MSKGIIVAGFGAIGKTTLGNKYDNVIDMDQDIIDGIILVLKIYHMSKEKVKKKDQKILSGQITIIKQL